MPSLIRIIIYRRNYLKNWNTHLIKGKILQLPRRSVYILSYLPLRDVEVILQVYFHFAKTDMLSIPYEISLWRIMESPTD